MTVQTTTSFGAPVPELPVRDVERAQKPWGLRQFTVEDLDRNRFYFYCD